MSKSKNLLLGLLSTAATMFSCGNKDGNEVKPDLVVVKPDTVEVYIDLGRMQIDHAGLIFNPADKSKFLPIVSGFRFDDGTTGLNSNGVYMTFSNTDPNNLTATSLGLVANSTKFERFNVVAKEPVTVTITNALAPDYGLQKKPITGVAQIFENDPHDGLTVKERHYHLIKGFVADASNITFSVSKTSGENPLDIFRGTHIYQGALDGSNNFTKSTYGISRNQ